MKKILLLIPVIIISFASASLMAAGGADKKHKKIAPYIPDVSKFRPVCHKANHRNIDKLPAGNPQPFLLWVPNNNAFKKHLAHGKKGHGDVEATLIPGSNPPEYTCDEVGPVCGNGIPEPPEECDDGNLINRDGCSDVCKFEGG